MSSEPKTRRRKTRARTTRAPETVDPLIPLTLLEAVRTVDRPDAADVEEVEYVPELLNKRLGMHERVHTAIRRYAEAVRKSQRIEITEVAALAKLIGRRPDALIVFEAAGAAMAQQAYRKINGLTRALIRILPAFASRPWARRRARKIVKHYFGGTVERYGANVRLRLPAWRAIQIEENGHHQGTEDSGSAYYDAGFRELLGLLSLN